MGSVFVLVSAWSLRARLIFSSLLLLYLSSFLLCVSCGAWVAFCYFCFMGGGVEAGLQNKNWFGKWDKAGEGALVADATAFSLSYDVKRFDLIIIYFHVSRWSARRYGAAQLEQHGEAG